MSGPTKGHATAPFSAAPSQSIDKLITQVFQRVPLARPLLLIFLERPQRVLSRDQLLNLTRNRDAEPFDRSIDVQISRLRQKLEQNPKKPTIIKTIRGGGYMLSLPVKRI